MSSLKQILSDPRSLRGDAADRLRCEIRYANEVSAALEGRFDLLLAGVADDALAFQAKNGVVTADFAASAERALSQMAAECKRFKWLFAGHAHIDMNWMWRYDETVAVTLDTFRTMLTLMREYPLFTFSQSQAVTYEIVEKYDPPMLEEIRARVREGRWEVTASSWVEPDRNMPCMESEIRHLLYTKNYLSGLLGVSPERLNIDFEPDTFGHNARVPDMMQMAGVRYLYHCRGEASHSLYRWRGAGGGEVLAYRDPAWYNLSVGGEQAARLPSFCREYGVPALLTVYGVGDHGGGPTRRDLNRILDMMDWPIFPTVAFGTYGEFFALCEKSRHHLPLLTGERNCVFTGCYTSQSRIKKANAMAERMLGAGETFAAFARAFADGAYRADAHEAAWRRVLFNHFHDILPGSCVRDAREYAMGQYQEAFAAATAARRSAYAAIAQAIDTSAFPSSLRSDETAQGAGIGFRMADGGTPPYSLTAGDTRIFHVLNPLPFEREEIAEITVWDYLDGCDRMRFTDENGAALPHQIIGDGIAIDWSHHFTSVLVPVRTPACGYATVILRKSDDPPSPPLLPPDMNDRVHAPFSMTLENDRIAVCFDPLTARMTRLTDKATGVVTALDSGFDFIMEDPSLGMTSWTMGRWMSVRPLGVGARVKKTLRGPLREAYEVTMPFGEHSSLRYTVSLDKDADRLVYAMDCDWREQGGDGGVPLLSFSLRLPADEKEFMYRIPGGQLARAGEAQDKPSLGGMSAGGMTLMCDGRYGFRGDGAEMRVSLVRGSFDPDPLPEYGQIACRMAVGLTGNAGLHEEIEAFSRPMDTATNTCHAGALPLRRSFLQMEGDRPELFGLKESEDGAGIIAHLGNPTRREMRTRLILPQAPLSAAIVDYLERPVADCLTDGSVVPIVLPAEGMTALKITFR